MKELYCRTCKDCQKVFRTDQPKKQYCPSCTIKRKRASNAICQKNRYKNYYKTCAKRAKSYNSPLLSIAEVLKIQKQYNEANGTRLSYGQIVAKIGLGKIKLVFCEGGVNYGGEQ